ncbi:MAG TPA: YqaJ viral recombinase family protein, partial [Ottowia sp.]|nr:YqaJ viral recombinase family protein [Ottowia sp.]
MQQGTGAWLRLREGFPTASEAPAALGVSKYVTRSELLRRKHTGVQPEPDAATLGKFAAGHAAEAEARPLAEGIVGSDLFPTTMSATVDGLPLLASLDGQTLEGDVIWETKLWNEDLAAAVRANDLPAHYTVQMDQELLVSGAERCLFTCTDGTPERFVSCWYEADEGKFRELLAGWLQFNRDLAAYVVPQAAEPAPAGKAPDTLPALRIELTGQVTASNLAEFKATALGAIRAVNRDLQTDQHFADAEKAVKWCADVEQRLAAAKDHALSQTATIDALFKTIDDISSEARRVRLDLDKLVTRRKGELKDAEVARARDALSMHVLAVNAEISPARLQHVAELGAAIKGLKTLDSVRAKLDAAVAAEKVCLDTRAREIRENLTHFRAAGAGLGFLFSDLAALALRPADDFRTLVAARIEQHKAAEARKEAERQAAEAARIAAAEQRARDEAAAAERQRMEADARAAEQARQDEQDREDARRRALDLERQAATVPAPIQMQIVPPSAPSQPEPATL